MLTKGTSKEAVDTFFLDQIKKGYMEEIIDLTEINSEDCNYIPYFPVVRLDKLTSKVRIIFAAATKNRDKLFLNSQIEKGPNRLQDLFGILLRFRQHAIALTADISEMFLQCRLDKKKSVIIIVSGEMTRPGNGLMSCLETLLVLTFPRKSLLLMRNCSGKNSQQQPKL